MYVQLLACSFRGISTLTVEGEGIRRIGMVSVPYLHLQCKSGETH